MYPEEKFILELKPCTLYVMIGCIVTDLNCKIGVYLENEIRFLFLRHHGT